MFLYCIKTCTKPSFQPKFFDVFKIPEDKLQGNQYSKQDIEKIDIEIDQLTNRYKRVSYVFEIMVKLFREK